MKVKKIAIIIIPILIILTSISIVFMNKKEYKVTKILKNKYYSYLPKEAKEFIQNVYEETGEIVLTEKNKEDNKPYLNPEFVEYLELSKQERKETEVVPDTYITDYIPTTNKVEGSLPSSYDLRNVNGKNFVSSMKDQGNTSLCWAFTSVENAETLILKQKNESFSSTSQTFSARQIDYATSNNKLIRNYNNPSTATCNPIDSCSYTLYDNSANANRPLGDSGNFYTSSILMANGLSLVSESTFPWNEGTNGKWSGDILNYSNSKYEVNSTIHLPQISKDTATTTEINNYVSLVKSYMVDYGGPYVGTYSPESTCGFKNTDGKQALKTDNCVSVNAQAGHAMQIIGWNDNYSYAYCDNGTTHTAAKNGTCSSGTYTTGKGAWILRNSWGEDPDYKIIYLTYDSTRLSISFITSLSEMSSRVWDNNYHGNPWINGSVYNGISTTTSQTQEFSTESNEKEKIEKIKFFSFSTNGSYSLSIIDGDTTYNNIATITTPYSGIYTFTVSNKNIVIKNSNFKVKINSTNGGYLGYDSISVFTSNTKWTPYATYKWSGSLYTYDNNAENQPSENNPFYVYSTNTVDNMVLETNIRNIPVNANLQYRVTYNGTNYSQNFFTTTNYYPRRTNNYIYFEAIPSSNSNICGKNYNFEILYNNQIVLSIPLKRVCRDSSNNLILTKSTIKFHKNDGSNTYTTSEKNDLTEYQFLTDDEQGTAEDIGDKTKLFIPNKHISSWNTKADGTGISYTTNKLELYTNTDLYAQWSNGQGYNIQYQCENNICREHEVQTTTKQVEYNKDYSILNSQFTPLDNTKEFIYWKDSSNKIYYTDEKVNNLAELSPYYYEKTVTLSAVWSSNYKTISFNSNTGQGTMSDIKVNTSTPTRIKYNSFSKSGYDFKEWNTKADGTGTSYKNGQEISTSSNVTLYAQWKKSVPANFKVSYTTHVQSIGWQNYVSNGQMAGTSGQGKRLEAIKIKLENAPYEGNILYKTHIQSYGWEKNYKQNDGVSGTSGEGKRLEAIEIKLDGEIADYYDVYYRVHAQHFGWLGWAKNGEKSGTAGYAYRLEAIEIKLVEKGDSVPEYGQIEAYKERQIVYTTHVQSYGWQNYVSDGEMAGTSGEAKRLEAIKIRLDNQKYTGDVIYKTHVQTYGWENKIKKNDEMSGTSGEAKRLEAIQIKLTDEMAEHYDIYYRVHAQSFGWLAWAKNGEEAGTAGYAKRLEGIEIVLVEKGGQPPQRANQNSNQPFIENK